MEGRFFLSVARRAVPAGLVVAAAFADASGSAHIAFYAILALVPVAAVIALNSYGELVEEERTPEEDASRRLQALLWVSLLGLAVLGAASRYPALGEGSIPKLAATALIAALVVLCVEGVVELVAQLRRPAAQPSVRVDEVWASAEAPAGASER
jgi:hypothetical protein